MPIINWFEFESIRIEYWKVLGNKKRHKKKKNVRKLYYTFPQAGAKMLYISNFHAIRSNVVLQCPSKMM